jgi:hypothetical protein
MFDAVCCRLKVVNPRLQLLALVCMSLTFKYYSDEDSDDFWFFNPGGSSWTVFRDFVECCSGLYTREQIIDAEWEVFGVFDGFVRYPTPDEYMRLVYADKNEHFLEIANRYVPALLAHRCAHQFTTAQLATAAAYAAGAKCPTLTTDLKNFAADALTNIPKELPFLKSRTPAMLLVDKY